MFGIDDSEQPWVEVFAKVEASVAYLWHLVHVAGVEECHANLTDSSLIGRTISLELLVCLILAVCFDINADQQCILVDVVLEGGWHR